MLRRWFVIFVVASVLLFGVITGLACRAYWATDIFEIRQETVAGQEHQRIVWAVECGRNLILRRSRFVESGLDCEQVQELQRWIAAQPNWECNIAPADSYAGSWPPVPVIGVLDDVDPSGTETRGVQASYTFLLLLASIFPAVWVVARMRPHIRERLRAVRCVRKPGRAFTCAACASLVIWIPALAGWFCAYSGGAIAYNDFQVSDTGLYATTWVTTFSEGQIQIRYWGTSQRHPETATAESLQPFYSNVPRFEASRKADYPPLIFNNLPAVRTRVAGLEWWMGRQGLPSDGFREAGLLLPGWMPSLLLGLIPAAWFVLWTLHRLTVRPGFCPQCGYDLRATPGRCPECGMFS